MLPVITEAIFLGTSPIGNISYLCKWPNFDLIINIWQRKKKKITLEKEGHSDWMKDYRVKSKYVKLC